MSYLESDFTNKEALLMPTPQEFCEWINDNYSISLSENAPEYQHLRDKFNEVFLADLEIAENAKNEKFRGGF